MPAEPKTPRTRKRAGGGRRGQSGALLLERGMALALFAALATLSLQGWRHLGQEQRVVALADAFASLRLGALAFGCTRICLLDGGDGCGDRGRALLATPCGAGRGEVLHSWSMEGAHLVWKDLSTKVAGTGFNAQGGALYGPGSLWLCQGGQALAQISVNRSGRARLRRGAELGGGSPC